MIDLIILIDPAFRGKRFELPVLDVHRDALCCDCRQMARRQYARASAQP
jgi:hypothetical protein